MDSLLDALKKWCEVQPNKPLWTYLDDKCKIKEAATYFEIDKRSSNLATWLIREYNLKAGDRVILVYPPSLDFIISFMACIRVGLIAVPVYPPDPRKAKRDLSAFVKTSQDCEAQIALTSSIYDHMKKASELKSKVTKEGAVWPDLKWIVTDKFKFKSKLQNPDVSIGENDIAFIQYTSGSTSDPKGVMISHGNLAHNLKLIVNKLEASVETIVVSWLPQYHDMGLIGSLLGALYCGGSGYYMNPLSFIQSPLIWVKAISAFRGTHMQAPNFAYGLCARKWRECRTDEQPTLDLSCVRHMINGAEPVSESSMEAFYEAFIPCGLKDGVIFPTYGLAEHTVFVCTGGKQKIWAFKDEIEINKELKICPEENKDKGKLIIGCGYPFNGGDIDLKIVNSETRKEVEKNKIGEIWIKSKSKARGYWNMHGKSVNTFCAEIENFNDLDQDLKDKPKNSNIDFTEGYLRTGDEGFLYKNELFVCGRIKDMIIMGGRNFYPQDIEVTVFSSRADALRPGCLATFGIEKNGREELILSCELRESVISSTNDDFEILCKNVLSAVRIEHGITVHKLLLVRPKTNPKTTSGKIARQWCKKAYLSGNLSILFEKDGANFSELESSEANNNLKEFNEPVLEDIELSEIKKVSTSPINEKIDPVALTDEELQQRLSYILSKITTDIEISLDHPLHELGLDSLTLGQFSGLIEKNFGAIVPIEAMYNDSMTLVVLAEVVKAGGVEGVIGVNAGDKKAMGKVEKFLTNSCPCCLCFMGCICCK
mmetsp:Transcript_18922/g.26657  ORF Transcript_18922/g.26657 Transcript_18922/m.26657 type:complete len:768 (-) Transcript_18922:76-2379(-)